MGPPFKKRKFSQPAEILFDASARQEYLTGYHKRKEQRKKHAQEVAAKQEKEDRLRDRRERRKQRQYDLEQHIVEVNTEIRKQNRDIGHSSDSDLSLQDGNLEQWKRSEETLDYSVQNSEYVDEEKYTTVTVEPLMTNEEDDEKDMAKPGSEAITRVRDPEDTITSKSGKRSTRNKDDETRPKKKKFRYETKAERQVTRQKQNRSSRAARARRQAKT